MRLRVQPLEKVSEGQDPREVCHGRRFGKEKSPRVKLGEVLLLGEEETLENRKQRPRGDGGGGGSGRSRREAKKKRDVRKQGGGVGLFQKEEMEDLQDGESSRHGGEGCGRRPHPRSEGRVLLKIVGRFEKEFHDGQRVGRGRVEKGVRKMLRRGRDIADSWGVVLPDDVRGAELAELEGGRAVVLMVGVRRLPSGGVREIFVAQLVRERALFLGVVLVFASLHVGRRTTDLNNERETKNKDDG